MAHEIRIPSRLSWWTVAAAGACLGLLLGLGSFTFVYAEGFSYFSKDPKACVNCHIMQPQYNSWQKASHHTSATCVDCHLPHTLIRKYLAKAENGYFHSKGFTFQDFHEPILIKKKNREILQENCVACHEGLIHELAPGAALDDTEEFSCVHCHHSVGHGAQTGLGGMDHSLTTGESTWPF